MVHIWEVMKYEVGVYWMWRLRRRIQSISYPVVFLYTHHTLGNLLHFHGFNIPICHCISGFKLLSWTSHSYIQLAAEHFHWDLMLLCPKLPCSQHLLVPTFPHPYNGAPTRSDKPSGSLLVFYLSLHTLIKFCELTFRTYLSLNNSQKLWPKPKYSPSWGLQVL